MGLGGRALQPLGSLTKSTHAGSWSSREQSATGVASRHDDVDAGFGLVAPRCQLYGRPYMRTDLRKTDRTLQVSPVATQCGQKTAHDIPAPDEKYLQLRTWIELFLIRRQVDARGKQPA
jgi:hypothetical protein